MRAATKRRLGHKGKCLCWRSSQEFYPHSRGSSSTEGMNRGSSFGTIRGRWQTCHHRESCGCAGADSYCMVPSALAPQVDLDRHGAATPHETQRPTGTLLSLQHFPLPCVPTAEPRTPWSAALLFLANRSGWSARRLPAICSPRPWPRPAWPCSRQIASSNTPHGRGRRPHRASP